MKTISLVPAYGRDYFDSYSVKQDFEDGKDFKIHGGPYTNKEDLVKEYSRILVWYRQRTRICEIKI